jgi:transposase-like protein
VSRGIRAVLLFAFPPATRKMIYTTNAVESLHRSLRKTIKTRGSYPIDEAALKLLFLAIPTDDCRGGPGGRTWPAKSFWRIDSFIGFSRAKLLPI